MPKRVDTAYIEFLPDFKGFDTAVTRSVATAMQHVERTVDRTATDVSQSFDGVERDIEQVFNDIARTGAIDMEALVGVAERTASLVHTSFETGNEAAERSFAELQHSANRDLDQIAVKAATTAGKSSSSFSAMGLLGSSALLGVGTAATAGLGLLTAMGLKSAASLEQTQISFNALLGSATEGTKVFKDLQQFANLTPFEFPDVAAAGKRFLAFHDSVGLATSGLQDYLTTIGNVISVTGGGGESFGRISLAIGQIGSASKVTLDNLNQIADAIPGFSPISAIAKNLGISTAEAMQKISSGSLPAAEGVQALLKGMKEFPGAAGAMEMQSKTLLGVFSTFQDTVSQALAGAFAPAIPAIKNSLTELTPIIGDALKDAAPALGGILSAILKAAGPIIKALSALLAPILGALGPAIDAILPALLPLIPVFAQLGVTLAPLIPLLANFLIAILEIAVPLIQLLLPVMKLLTPVFQFAADAVGAFAKWLGSINWGKVGSDIASGFSKGWHAVSDFFKGVGRFFANIPHVIVSALKALPELLLKMLDLALQAIGFGIGLMIGAFIAFPQMVLNAIINFPQDFVRFITDMWHLITKLFDDNIGAVVMFFVTLPDKIVTGLKLGWDAVTTFFKDAWHNLGVFAEDAVGKIIGFFVNLPGKLSSFAGDVGGGILDWLKARINSVIKGINAGIDKVDDALPGITLPRLPTLAQGAIVKQPTLAVIGEAGPEVVVPINKPARAQQLLNEAGMGTPSNGLSTPQMHFDVHVYVGDREITDIVDVRIDAKMRDVSDDLSRGPRAA